MDIVHMTNYTLALMEKKLQRPFLSVTCAHKACVYKICKKLTLQQHVPYSVAFAAIYLLFWIFSSFRDITTKHKRARHHPFKPGVIQVDTLH